MAASLTGAEFTPIILDARRASPDSHPRQMYLLWREALCRQLKWTVDSFERRMDIAEQQRQ